MEKVTLYIPWYNSQRFIGSCLDAVMKQSYPIDEILVIDDGSIDGTVKIASRYNVRIIRHVENKGLAAARNTAFKVARNEFVASLDADCAADIDWLKQLMSCFSDENIVGTGGKLIEKHFISTADRWRIAHMPQHWGEGFVLNPYFLYGSNNVYKKRAVESIGLYKEELKNNNEDVDISLRFYANKFKLAYNPQAIARHLKQDTVGSLLRRYWHWTRSAHINIYNKFNIKRRAASRLALILKITEKFSREDVKKLKLDLLFIDLILAPYFIYLDVVNLIKQVCRRIRLNS